MGWVFVDYIGVSEEREIYHLVIYSAGDTDLMFGDFVVTYSTLPW